MPAWVTETEQPYLKKKKRNFVPKFGACHLTFINGGKIVFMNYQFSIHCFVKPCDDRLFLFQDTEFPGVVVRPIGEFRSSIDYQYQLLRCNVDLLKIIQLGLTFTNEKGEYPSGINTWQFNFKFNLTEDMYSQDSIDLLANSGLQFQKHEEEGIDTLHFAELLMTSGVVLCDNVKWLSFHSGYDFGYMVKLLTDSRLPEEEHEFFHILNLFFPSIYDVKYLMKSCKNLKVYVIFFNTRNKNKDRKKAD
nr:CCR4-NOT transcription complex subunit 8 isoform X1 [Aotus nancymaae]